MNRKLWIFAAAALAYGSTFWPGPQIKDAGLIAAGQPAYEGVWIFLPHLLLYSTFTAGVCAVLWLALARKDWLPAPQLGFDRQAMIWGLGGGVVCLALLLGLVGLTAPSALSWLGLDLWKIGGNLFSNFFEEFIFRGFLLVALTALIGFWPAAIATSLAFGLGHEQYPMEMQMVVTVLGLIWCIVARQAKSLWAPWLSHTVLDVVADSLLA